MEYFEKVRDLWEAGEDADEQLLGQLQEYLEDIELKKARDVEAVLKYSQTEHGRLRRRIAQRNYRARQKAKEEESQSKL